MRLLNEKEVKDLKRAEVEQTVQETNRVSENLTASLKSLNELTTEYESQKKAYAEDLEKVAVEAEKIKAELKREIAGLESRRQTALEPLDALKKSLAQRENALSDREILLAKAEKEVEERKVALLDRAESLELEQSALIDQQERLNERLAALDEAEQTNYDMTVRLAESWSEFKRISAEKEQEFTAARHLIDLERATVEPEKKWVAGEKLRLKEQEKKISSDRSTLQNAFNEAKTKGII